MVTIRIANRGDAVALASLATQTFQEGWAAVIGEEAAHAYSKAYLNADRLAAEIAAIDAHYFALAVGPEDNTLLGYTKLALSASPPECVTGEHPVLLQRLYIATAGRGTGIADQLLQAAEAEALRRGYHTLYLECDPRNERATRFYMRRGFEVMGMGIYYLPTGVNDNIQIMMRPIMQERTPSTTNR